MKSTPSHPTDATGRRWIENRRRRRMLEGGWRNDLRDRILGMVSNRRAAIWGEGDTAKNVARSIISQLATLYNRPPSPIHEQEGAAMELRKWLAMAGHWELMRGFSPLIIGQREGLVRVDVVRNPVSGAVELLTRVVPADLVHVEAHPDAPDVPTRVIECCPRKNAAGEWVWSREVWDITDPSQPYYAIQDDEGNPWPGLEPLSGDAYKAAYAYSDGVPFIPGEWFHADRTGKLCDPYKGKELFDGTLTVAALWTFWSHVVVDSSWPQRYMANARIAGAASSEGDGTPFVEMDPSAVLMVEQAEPGLAVVVGQFLAGGDPQAIGDAIDAYAAGIATDFDISPADVQRATGDARSGFALEITNEGKRAAQQRYEMSFARHDAAMMGKICAMLNRAGVASLPESGWSIEYAGIPLGLSERKAQLEELEKMLQMGVTSKPAVLAKIKAIPISEARRELEEMRDDMIRYQLT